MRWIVPASKNHLLAFSSTILVITVFLPVTGAQDQPSMSLEFTNDYAGWHAFLIEPSADLVLRLLYWYGYTPNSIFYSFYDSNGTQLAGSVTDAYTSRDGVRIRYAEAGIDESVYHAKRLDELALGYEISVTNSFRNGIPERVTLLVGAAGDFEYWTLEILEGSARVLDHAQGTRVFSVSGTDFEGDLNVFAAHSGVGVGFRENATFEFDVHNQLLTTFSPSYTNFLVKSQTGTEIERLSITSPDGRETRCSCWWRDYAGPKSHGPGSYTYRLDAPRILYDVYVMGADVNIPWIQAD